MTDCARNCWIFAAVMGLVVLLFSLGGVGFMGGLFLGLVTTWLLGGLGVFLLCQGAGGSPGKMPREQGESARLSGQPQHRSIRSDGAPAARVAIARPQRPAGMAGAPAGTSAGGGQAVTFGPGKPTGAGGKGKPAPRRKGARALAADGDSAHSSASGDAAGSGEGGPA